MTQKFHCQRVKSRSFKTLGHLSLLMLVFLVMFQSSFSFAQDNGRTCATMEMHNLLLRNNPEYRQNLEAQEEFTENYLRNGAEFRNGIITIPVVVHVVYNTPAQNISDAQVQSQMAVLNEDYRRLNADVSLTPSYFMPFATDARIQFQLAVRDPNCNPTTGITRTPTTVTAFSYSNNGVKFATSGGHDAWPRDKYLNIWVCNLGNGLLGYAQFPGGPANTDGVVILYTAFGRGTQFALLPSYNKGRSATHEVGHWLNLRHIWGDDNGACTGSDLCNDTPNQGNSNFGCPANPTISCSNGPNGDMFMNFMDYTDDACMFMLTPDQSARMEATLMGLRNPLLSSDGLIPPVQPSDLFSQDLPDDPGDEPNVTSSYMWGSEDIWVRNQNDGLTNQEHQNPVYRDPALNQPNYVYVRIRNKGCIGSQTGNVNLYWAKASAALGWPAPWDHSIINPDMGDMIDVPHTVTVNAGNSTIV